MTTTLEILLAARALIEAPGSWCQGSATQYARGELVRRCGFGALWNIRDLGISVDHAEGLLGQVAGDRGYDSFPKFNDDPVTTHAMVLDAFDAAIEKARADG